MSFFDKINGIMIVDVFK